MRINMGNRNRRREEGKKWEERRKIPRKSECRERERVKRYRGEIRGKVGI